MKTLQEINGLTMYLVPCLDLINPHKKAMVPKGCWSCIIINTAGTKIYIEKGMFCH